MAFARSSSARGRSHANGFRQVFFRLKAEATRMAFARRLVASARNSCGFRLQAEGLCRCRCARRAVPLDRAPQALLERYDRFIVQDRARLGDVGLRIADIAGTPLFV